MTTTKVTTVVEAAAGVLAERLRLARKFGYGTEIGPLELAVAALALAEAIVAVDDRPSAMNFHELARLSWAKEQALAHYRAVRAEAAS